jgi:hypothetical protein
MGAGASATPVPRRLAERIRSVPSWSNSRPDFYDAFLGIQLAQEWDVGKLGDDPELTVVP